MLPELCFHIAKQFFIILMKLGGLLRNTLLHALVSGFFRLARAFFNRSCALLISVS